MAMGLPYGLQAMLKEGHKHFSGVEEAVIKNIDACKALSHITRTSLGPNGGYSEMVRVGRQQAAGIAAGGCAPHHTGHAVTRRRLPLRPRHTLGGARIRKGGGHAHVLPRQLSTAHHLSPQQPDACAAAAAA
jgi:hypothetical protein